MRTLLLLAAVCILALCSGCHYGYKGIYGCTGVQKRGDSTIHCPSCGESQKLDRLRIKAGIPWAPLDPASPLMTYEYYCQDCKTWWGAEWWGSYLFDWGPYERHPGWPWKSRY